MSMSKGNGVEPGRIVIISGGKYDGQGAQIRKVDAGSGSVAVLIAGKVVTLKIERVKNGG